MTGRYLILFCKKLSAVSAPTCPFRRLRRHLPPTSGDGLRVEGFVLCESFPYFLVLLIQKEQKGVYASFCSFIFLYLSCRLYFFVDFDDFSHVHAVVVVAVTAAVVFHVDFLVGVVVLRQFGGVDFFADEDEIRFFYGGGTV